MIEVHAERGYSESEGVEQVPSELVDKCDYFESLVIDYCGHNVYRSENSHYVVYHCSDCEKGIVVERQNDSSNVKKYLLSYLKQHPCRAFKNDTSRKDY